jgi:hypothetical protein
VDPYSLTPHTAQKEKAPPDHRRSLLKLELGTSNLELPQYR